MKSKTNLNFNGQTVLKRWCQPVISRAQPKSVYQLEKLTARKYSAVLKDCRQLQNLGFIKLLKSDGAKKVLYPELSFEYDIIRVRADLEEIFAISEKAIRFINRAAVG